MIERTGGAWRREARGKNRTTTKSTKGTTTGTTPRATTAGALLSLLLPMSAGGIFLEARAAEAPAATPATNAAPAAPAARPAATRAPTRGSSLDNRIHVLTKALNLDAKQQTTLRGILESQRDQVAKLWDNQAMPAAERIHATQSISDKTADRIRAMLNDEQKKKYNPPKLAQPAGSDAGKKSVEDWMKATRPK